MLALLLLASQLACQRPTASSETSSEMPTTTGSPASPVAPVAPTEAELGESETAPTPLFTLERQLGEGGPLVVAMHGRGHHPEGFAGLFEGWAGPASLVLPRASTSYGPGWSWFDLSVRSGDSPALGANINAAAAQVEALLDRLAARHPSAGKPVLIGFSQGGILAATLAVTAPEKIAGAVALGGWLPESLQPEAVPEGAPPLVFLHGEDDDVLPIAPTRASAEALKAAGWPVELRAFPGVRHAVSPEMQRQAMALIEAWGD